jgi:2-keto-4-pentenoate hydratase/2-oxohepta-3-ene-1,7-dioic acid hydratase in catechol pathway
MKIARCSRNGETHWVVVDVDANLVRPIIGNFEEWAPHVTSSRGIEHDLALAAEIWPLAGVRLLAPVERGATVYVAGANYLKHLTEFRVEPPTSPFAFLKPYGALTGPYDEIERSPLTEKLDFEVELVAVIGASLEDRSEVMQAVLGYTVGNDISARDLQRGPGGAIGMDFLSGKGLHHATPLGPWIVTRDEFGDDTPDLRLTLKVDGEIRQDGRTSEMRWNVAELVSFVNARSRLEPGDVLFTGTPAGVAQADGRFLRLGQIVEAGIERIGSLRNAIA